MSDLVGNPEDRFSQNEAHMFYESYCYQALFSIGERLPVSNVTQIEKDTVLVCNDSKYYLFKLINHFQAGFRYVHNRA